MYSVVVAPIDVSATKISERILAKALFHLQYSQCTIHLLVVAPANADESVIDQLSGELMQFAEEHIAAHEGRIHLAVKSGLPSDEILAFSKQVHADLIIMGSHRIASNLLGRSTLGSTTAKIASQTNCDVCIIKAVE